MSDKDLVPLDTAASDQELYDIQQQKLAEKGVRAPKPLGYTPYLKERRTGVVWPYSEALASRSDLVVGCYNKFGSQNPEDAEGDYDPRDGSKIKVPGVTAEELAVQKQEEQREMDALLARTAAEKALTSKRGKAPAKEKTPKAPAKEKAPKAPAKEKTPKAPAKEKAPKAPGRKKKVSSEEETNNLPKTTDAADVDTEALAAFTELGKTL